MHVSNYMLQIDMCTWQVSDNTLPRSVCFTNYTFLGTVCTVFWAVLRPFQSRLVSGLLWQAATSAICWHCSLFWRENLLVGTRASVGCLTVDLHCGHCCRCRRKSLLVWWGTPSSTVAPPDMLFADCVLGPAALDRLLAPGWWFCRLC